MREGNLYNDATTEDDTEAEDESAGIGEILFSIAFIYNIILMISLYDEKS